MLANRPQHTQYSINISGSLALFLRDTIFIEILDPDKLPNINFSLPTQSLEHAAKLCCGNLTQEGGGSTTESEKSESRELIRLNIGVTSPTRIIVKQGRPKLQDETARSDSPFWSFHATVRGLELALIPKRDVKDCKAEPKRNVKECKAELKRYEKALSFLEEWSKKRSQ